MKDRVAFPLTAYSGKARMLLFSIISVYLVTYTLSKFVCYENQAPFLFKFCGGSLRDKGASQDTGFHMLLL